jgi:hypothetical protein
LIFFDEDECGPRKKLSGGPSVARIITKKRKKAEESPDPGRKKLKQAVELPVSEAGRRALKPQLLEAREPRLPP